MNNELERMWQEAVVARFKISRNFTGVAEENRKNSVRIVGLRVRDLNPGRPEYEAGVLSTRP
jgi:hypothetical protein